MDVRRVNYTHANKHTRDSLKRMVSEKLEAEGKLHFFSDVDHDPTDDAYGFIVTTLAGSTRVTVED
jgi:hypothetical protein